MQHLKELFDRFLAETADFSDAYVALKLHYVAYRRDGGWHLFRARIFLTSDDGPALRPTFESRSVRAGEFFLPEGYGGLGRVFDEFCSGVIETPEGPLTVTFDETQRSRFFPFHEEGLNSQNMLSVLMVEPSQVVTAFAHPDIDWELRSAAVPYNALNELTGELSLGPPQTDGTMFEIVARPVAFVDYSSPIGGVLASPTVRIRVPLDPEQTSLAIRIESGGRIVERYVVPGGNMTWTQEPTFLRGSVDIKIPEGALVQCIVRYRGTAVHFAWLRDQKLSQNVRRVMLEAFDPQSAILTEFLFTEPGKGKSIKAGDFEQAVAWLLWYLGFSVAHLGGSPRLSEAPDIIAYTPMGKIAVVECTTGLLKAENKLANLVARTTRAKETLGTSIYRGARPLPVIVTARPRAEILAELEAAERLGVVVVTREGLTEALNIRSQMQPDADRIFAEAEQYIASRTAALSSELPAGLVAQ